MLKLNRPIRLIAALHNTSVGQIERTYHERRVRASYAPILLEADEIVYDSESKTVSAVGHVEITDEGRTLLADRVDYGFGASATTIGRIVTPRAAHNTQILECAAQPSLRRV
jgi:lipopolysaccharide assembly outer membrane protein LptD (OstA)